MNGDDAAADRAWGDKAILLDNIALRLNVSDHAELLKLARNMFLRRLRNARNTGGGEKRE